MKPTNYSTNYSTCTHNVPVTLNAAADQYLNAVRRIAKKMSVRDLLNPSGRMTNLTVVRNILNEEAERRKKRTVWATKFDDNCTKILVRATDESTWDSNEVHPSFPYDGMASMKSAVEEVAGYPVVKVGEAGGEILWLAVSE